MITISADMHEDVKMQLKNIIVFQYVPAAISKHNMEEKILFILTILVICVPSMEEWNADRMDDQDKRRFA